MANQIISHLIEHNGEQALNQALCFVHMFSSMVKINKNVAAVAIFCSN